MTKRFNPFLEFDQKTYEITGQYNFRSSQGDLFVFDDLLTAKAFIDGFYEDRSNAVATYHLEHENLNNLTI
jgi:hypothetical protein